MKLILKEHIGLNRFILQAEGYQYWLALNFWWAKMVPSDSPISSTAHCSGTRVSETVVSLLAALPSPTPAPPLTPPPWMPPSQRRRGAGGGALELQAHWKCLE